MWTRRLILDGCNRTAALEEAPAVGIGRIVISGAEEAESVMVGSICGTSL